MSQVIFVRPRHDYQSYSDLYALIQLSGYPLIYADELDPASDNTYIVTIYNGETAQGWPGARARIVLWDLEYHLDGLPAVPGISEVWASDRWYARLIGVRYVPMGSHAGLRSTAPVKRDTLYDAAFLGYMVPRRETIYTGLWRAGVRLPVTSAWDEERDRILASSTAYLHVHQHENVPAVPALRMVVAAAYALPVITETCADCGIFGDCVLPLAYGSLVENVAGWTRGSIRVFRTALRECGELLHQKLCQDMTFRTAIEAAL